MHCNFNLIFLGASKQHSTSSSRTNTLEQPGLWNGLKELARFYPCLWAIDNCPSIDAYYGSLMLGESGEIDERETKNFPCVFINAEKKIDGDGVVADGGGYFEISPVIINNNVVDGNYLAFSITFQRRIDLYRAVGVLMGALASTSTLSISSNIRISLKTASVAFPMTQSTALATNGVMLDCSRNAVPTLNTLFMFVRYCALAGINCILLYMEDTYQVQCNCFPISSTHLSYLLDFLSD